MWLSSCTPACRASTLWRTMEPDSSWRWCHSCVLLHLQTCKCGPKKKFHTARHCMSDQTIITHTHNTRSVRQMICSFSTWQKKSTWTYLKVFPKRIAFKSSTNLFYLFCLCWYKTFYELFDMYRQSLIQGMKKKYIPWIENRSLNQEWTSDMG